MFAWLMRRRAYRALVEADAAALVARYGPDAYLEARLRSHRERDLIDGNRPPEHWARVKEAIRRRESQR